MGATFYKDVDDFCEQHPDVVVLASSILSFDNVVRKIPVQRLKRSTLFVDVLSVKVFPKNLLLGVLPEEVDILCTHPMFGPDSGKGSWEGLNFMYEKVRIGEEKDRQERVDSFLSIFRDEGCRMVEMTCEEHDRDAASTQFITHSVGRTLGAMKLQKTDIDTKGYESLLSLVENTANDSFDLYYGLFLYNPNATEELERLEQAFDKVKRRLFSQLHEKLREQLNVNESNK
jgi:arogenate dehydrogenase (NADP+)